MIRTYIREVKAMLEGAMSVPVYHAKIPEVAPLPAMYFIGAGTQRGQTIKRNRLPDVATFRVGLVVNDLSELPTLLTELGSLDLTQNDDFQQIEIVYARTEEQDMDSTAQRLFFDINVTEKV